MAKRDHRDGECPSISVVMLTVLAVAASLLTATFYMLRDGVEYRDFGPDPFDRTDSTKTIVRLTRRPRDLGSDVEVKPKAA